MKVSSPQPFIDSLTLRVKSGHGGAGASSYRREYKIVRGGPDGGDGGRGGSVYIKGDSRKHTFLDYRYKRIYTAQDGESGRGTRCYGRSGEDKILYVPLGTQIYDAHTDALICDVIEETKYKILEGGKGGLGNWHFKSSKNQTPSYSQKGIPGEELDLRLELKLMSDVGLVGFPNAGKSMLLTRLSNAKTKVGTYPFTTLNPQLGVLRHKGQEVVLADLPGLIEGASKGLGLGHRFLKHIERTQKILHLVSLNPEEPESPLDRYRSIRRELKGYDSGEAPLSGEASLSGEAPLSGETPLSGEASLSGMVPLTELKEIIVLTQSDLIGPEEIERQIKNFEERRLKVIVISSVTYRNVNDLKDILIEKNNHE